MKAVRQARSQGGRRAAQTRVKRFGKTCHKRWGKIAQADIHIKLPGK